MGNNTIGQTIGQTIDSIEEEEKKGILDRLTSRFKKRESESLTPKQKLVYAFLVSEDVDPGNASDLFYRLQNSQWNDHQAAPETESEFERTLDELATDGFINVDYRVSTTQ